MLAWVVINRRHFTQSGLREGPRQRREYRLPGAPGAKGAICSLRSASSSAFPIFFLTPYIITSLLPLTLARLPSLALSPLDATLMGLPASVANKRLTAWLSPLDATLTKNQGGGGREAIR